MRKTDKQFTEEIFQRSEERLLEETKKRKSYIAVGKAMAACLVFFIAVGTISFFWEGDNRQETESATEGMIEGEMDKEHEGEHVEGAIGQEHEGEHAEGSITESDKEIAQGSTSEKEEDVEVEIEAIERPKLTSKNLMEGIEREIILTEIQDVQMQDYLTNYQMNLYVELFQQAFAKMPNENTLISPLSISAALGMTANGAKGDTAEEFKQLLFGEYGIEEYNGWFGNFLENLPSVEGAKLSLANSIWFQDDEKFAVNEVFLQRNADYYGASLYKSAFDQTTICDINQWVNFHTDGMIDEIVDQVDREILMCLINAVAFDGKWEKEYREGNIKEDIFTDYSGEKDTVTMMCSSEMIYLADENTTGFMKPYKDETYYFVALLPDASVSIEDYVKELTAEKVQNLLDSQVSKPVYTWLPKFSYEYQINLKPILRESGLDSAFDRTRADFSGIGDFTDESIAMDEVIHKTFIQVDEEGTKAAGSTIIWLPTDSAVSQIDEVRLDRPFVYMIVDGESNLPVFMGTVMDLNE